MIRCVKNVLLFPVVDWLFFVVVCVSVCRFVTAEDMSLHPGIKQSLTRYLASVHSLLLITCLARGPLICAAVLLPDVSQVAVFAPHRSPMFLFPPRIFVGLSVRRRPGSN